MYRSFASLWRYAAVLLLTIWISPSVAVALVTWNVAELSDPNPKRIQRLLNVARSVQPDLLLLQEVESETFRALKQEKAFGPDYLLIYEERRDGLPNGGLMILAKRELSVSQPQYHVLPSEMGRGVLMVSFAACGSHIHVANLHLESPDLLFWRSLNFRHQQIDRINQLTKEAPHWILAGDFNPVFERNPDHLFSEEWIDAWIEKHPRDEGLTWDPDRNAMAYQSGGFILSGYRLDRVFFKSKVFKVKEIERLGIDAVKPLSDHYGVRVELLCREY